MKIPDPPFNPRCVKSSSDTLAIAPIIYLELEKDFSPEKGEIQKLNNPSDNISSTEQRFYVRERISREEHQILRINMYANLAKYNRQAD